MYWTLKVSCKRLHLLDRDPDHNPDNFATCKRGIKEQCLINEMFYMKVYHDLFVVHNMHLLDKTLIVVAGCLTSGPFTDAMAVQWVGLGRAGSTVFWLNVYDARYRTNQATSCKAKIEISQCEQQAKHCTELVFV